MTRRTVVGILVAGTALAGGATGEFAAAAEVPLGGNSSPSYTGDTGTSSTGITSSQTLTTPLAGGGLAHVTITILTKSVAELRRGGGVNVSITADNPVLLSLHASVTTGKGAAALNAA